MKKKVQDLDFLHKAKKPSPQERPRDGCSLHASAFRKYGAAHEGMEGLPMTAVSSFQRCHGISGVVYSEAIFHKQLHSYLIK